MKVVTESVKTWSSISARVAGSTICMLLMRCMEQRAGDHKAGPKGKNTVVPKQVTGTRFATLAKNGHGQSVRYQIRRQDQEAKWEHELRSGPTEQCSIESGCKSRVQNQSEVFISQAKKVQGSRQ